MKLEQRVDSQDKQFDGAEGAAHNVIACTALNPHSTLLNIEPVPQVLKQVVNLSC